MQINSIQTGETCVGSSCRFAYSLDVSHYWIVECQCHTVYRHYDSSLALFQHRPTTLAAEAFAPAAATASEQQPCKTGARIISAYIVFAKKKASVMSFIILRRFL